MGEVVLTPALSRDVPLVVVWVTKGAGGIGIRAASSWTRDSLLLKLLHTVLPLARAGALSVTYLFSRAAVGANTIALTSRQMIPRSLSSGGTSDAHGEGGCEMD